jgi:hypothetical protein
MLSRVEAFIQIPNDALEKVMLNNVSCLGHVTELYQEKCKLEVKSIFTWNLKALLSGQLILEMKFIWSHLLKYALFL